MLFRSGANVYAQNQLFATLDPTARKFVVHGVEFLLVDTVGFLQDLPHNLIDAFKSTLESALHCDLALIVCDATGEFEMQKQTTLQTLEELHFSSPYLLVMNKCETLEDYTALPFDAIPVSAKTGFGLNQLKRAILQQFQEEFLFCELFVPYARTNDYAKLKKYVSERKITYFDDGQTVLATIPTRFAELFQEYIKSIEKI